MNKITVRIWALIRILMGWIFLWAFLDKLLGLGFATAPDRSWLAGVSPTTGFLQHATYGPFVGIFHSIAGNAAVDWLFMMGLLGVGLSLVFGILFRVGVISGVTMLFLMYLAMLPPKNNPIVDEHIVYIGVLIGLVAVRADLHWGLAGFLKRKKIQ